MENIKPEAVWENVIIADSMWAVPKDHSFKSCLQKLYKNHGMYKTMAKKLQSHLKSTRSEEQQYEKFVDALGVKFDSSTVEQGVKVFG